MESETQLTQFDPSLQYWHNILNLLADMVAVGHISALLALSGAYCSPNTLARHIPCWNGNQRQKYADSKRRQLGCVAQIRLIQTNYSQNSIKTFLTCFQKGQF